MALTVTGPIIRGTGEGEKRWFYGGGVHTWKATSEETGSAFLLFEDRMDQGKVTPLHIHPDADESMYVLEGEVLVHIDGDEHRLATGGFVMAPRGVPHAFLVLSGAARLLCLHTPGGGDAFYRGASEPVSADGTPGPVDVDRVRASAEQHGGIVILGPPPFARPLS